MIDTERGSASKYADLFAFDVLELDSFDPDLYTAAILMEYCWRQRPPFGVPDLAHFLGRPKNTVYNWVNHYQIPDAPTLADIARRTGIPLDTLFAAASAPGEEQPAAPEVPVAGADPWEELTRQGVARLIDRMHAYRALAVDVARLREEWLGRDDAGDHGYHDTDVTPLVERARALLGEDS